MRPTTSPAVHAPGSAAVLIQIVHRGVDSASYSRVDGEIS
jgi:hypothetical protein